MMEDINFVVKYYRFEVTIININESSINFTAPRLGGGWIGHRVIVDIPYFLKSTHSLIRGYDIRYHQPCP